MNKIDLDLAKEVATIRNSTRRSTRRDFVATYLEREYLNGKTRNERVLILRTRGCSWSYHSGCSMCGFWGDTNPNIGSDDLIAQVNSFLKEFPEGEVLKVFTSGSFFDPVEIHPDIQKRIMEDALERYEYMVVETRPEFVKKASEWIWKYSGKLQVAIGLESTDKSVLVNSINKDYDFENFKEAAQLLHSIGISVRTYLLLKPPFMTEAESILDVVRSAREVSEYSDFISINPMDVQKGTLVESLYKQGNYRPPWLWSVVEVLLSLKDLRLPVVSLITAAGKKRGAHNGHVCDRTFSEAIRKYSETLDYGYLESLSCSCKDSWETFLKIEENLGISIGEIEQYDE
ncbi:MAG: archaeosine biosynthesis radical SAM protein RaSEA [Thermoplasmatales archaeon]